MGYLMLAMTLVTSVIINVYAFISPPLTVTEIKREYVAISEVPIPLTYNVDELDAYCKADWSVRNG